MALTLSGAPMGQRLNRPTIGATCQTLPGASFVVNGEAQASEAALVTGSAEIKARKVCAGANSRRILQRHPPYAGQGVVRYRVVRNRSMKKPAVANRRARCKRLGLTVRSHPTDRATKANAA